MHPTAADACLHLSAIPDSPTAEATVGRVPISLSALAAPERRDGLQQDPWASTASTPQGSAVHGDMTLATSQGQLRVRGLLSKGMAVAAQRQAALQGQLLHYTSWQAAAPASYSSLTASPQPAALQLRLTRRRLIQVAAGLSVQQPLLQVDHALQRTLRTAAGALQALQQHANGGCRTVSSSSTTDVAGDRRAAQGSSEAVLHALLRVAASESPSLAFASVQASAQTIQGSVQQQADAYGVVNCGGALIMPQLQPAPMQRPAAGGTAGCGSIMISGGLGGLGSLVGQFMAQAGAQHVLLMGRSGRGDVEAGSFGEACVTMQRCDVGSANEVRCTARHCFSYGKEVKALK